VLAPHSAPLTAFVWGRLVRDSGADVLPLSALGGFVMGARAATLLGLSGAVAIASTIVDVTLEVVGQVGYIALGLAIFALQKPDAYLIGWISVALVVLLIAAIGFIAVQRHQRFGMMERAAWRVANRWISDMAAPARPIHQEIHDIYSRPRRICASSALHFIAWVASSVEAWIALDLMGAKLGIGSVIVIESLLYTIRSVAFAVPNAVGVQEGAYIMLGATFGLTPETALALSLLKRGRDLTVGIPALLVWQFLEGRRLAKPPN
jgi:putative membrane protein